jgi:alpha,alpha-trehalase
MWLDFSLKTNQTSNKNFYISNLAPLWSGIAPPSHVKPEQIIDRHKERLLKYTNGVPVSFVDTTTEQWDFPHVFPPLQHSIITMLMNYDCNSALIVAKRFFNTVYTSYQRSNGSIFGKYSVLLDGNEMNESITENQAPSGYAWTYGVILDLINNFSDKIITEN